MRGEKRERVCMCGEKLVAAGPSPPFFCRARVLPPCLSQRNTCAARCKFKTRSLAACSPTKPHLLHRFLVRDCRTGRIEGGMTSARSRDIERRRSFNDASSLEEMERRQALHCRGRAWRGLGLGSLEEACLHLVVEGNMEAAKRGERKSERAKGSLSSLPLSPSAFFFFLQEFVVLQTQKRKNLLCSPFLKTSPTLSLMFSLFFQLFSMTIVLNEMS